MGFEGFACTELKRDRRDGVYKVVDVNGRHNLSGLLAVRAGINFPLLHYEHLVEGRAPASARFRQGVYWTDLYRDLGYSLAYLRRERPRPADLVRPYARRHVDAIYDPRDMAPFWARLRYLASHGVAGARGLLSR
jgi:predicted ATP-grasp superfamily ATP-dependent carboligase